MIGSEVGQGHFGVGFDGNLSHRPVSEVENRRIFRGDHRIPRRCRIGPANAPPLVEQSVGAVAGRGLYRSLDCGEPRQSRAVEEAAAIVVERDELRGIARTLACDLRKTSGCIIAIAELVFFLLCRDEIPNGVIEVFPSCPWQKWSFSIFGPFQGFSSRPSPGPRMSVGPALMEVFDSQEPRERRIWPVGSRKGRPEGPGGPGGPAVCRRRNVAA